MAPPSALARIRYVHAASGRREIAEVDAYSFLSVLARHDSDVAAAWTNRLGQTLSTRRILDEAWAHYVTADRVSDPLEDHSMLHLPEVLLEWSSRPEVDRDPNDIKRRFLAVELAQREFDGIERSEQVAHHVDGLGRLVAEPSTSWIPDERCRVRSWLAELEEHVGTPIGDLPLQHLAHMARGLRDIDRHRGRLAD